MARCANCEHPATSHALNGCDYSGQESGSCNCPFEYNWITKKFKAVPMGPAEKECRCCGHALGWHHTKEGGDARCSRCESCDGFLDENVANPDRAKAADSQVGGEHYRQTGIQPWDVIDAWGLDFYAGNALKYLYRAGRKGAKVEDLKKARHYIDKMIEKEES